MRPQKVFPTVQCSLTGTSMPRTWLKTSLYRFVFIFRPAK
ncbi:Uncharacterised protein [Bordetella pertussis]|nr:Uncharacterised protein [Bordetella pertussis]CFP59828.1 Uncharacterised protein [Bordetella pertussis]